ncbi:amidohydrolase family protein [Rhizobium rhizogenes]|uniref:amidohydrolase family protein n=1 Tax=Rhizobium rhizogenes TaxID=359 RepID=UPI0012961153|nr:amidohydrolase family protein [Rhizobium rhizogenes]MQB34288.1 cytosine deaminase [Rhizobium rhizogenes]
MSRILLKGATVITMAAGRPDAERLDILVQDNVIHEMAPDLYLENAEIVNFSDRILIPGLVNAHIHTWQAALRTMGADWTLLQYIAKAHGGLAGKYRPEDMAIAGLGCALNQINCGTTTIGDWCHNARTPDHAEATIQGLTQSGIRAVFLHGTAHKIRETAQPAHEIDRLLRGSIAANPLLTMGMAIPGPQYSGAEVALADFRTARDRDLVISMHQSGGRPGKSWEIVHRAGLISARTNIVHGNDLPDDWLRIFIDAGANFTSTPENELSQGHGMPITGRLRDLGVNHSLGTDTDTVLSNEVLIAARVALALQRGLDHEKSRLATGLFSPTPTITSKDALSWLTVEGARALGLSERIGRLQPGMQADIVAIDCRGLNLFPTHEPVAAALQASIANIEAVMIAGRWRKRDHTLLDIDIDSVRSRLQKSADYLVEASTPRGAIGRLREKVVLRVVNRTLRKQSRTTQS